MDGDRLPEAIGAFYDAASGAAPWDAAGEALRALCRAETASLYVVEPAVGTGIEMLYAQGGIESGVRAYVAHYSAFDPWIPELAMRARAGELVTRLGQDLVTEAEYRRSEFYNDFARGIGLYHVIGAGLPLGDGLGAALLGVHRSEERRPFGENDRRLVEAVLPHARRAVQLWRRLACLRDAERARAGLAAFDALDLAVLVVDAAMRVVFANAAAERLAASGRGLGVGRAGPPPGTLLTAARRSDGDALRRAVRSVALGGAPGAALCLLPPDGADAAALAALVSPLPAHLGPRPGGGWGALAAGLALVIVRDLARPMPPRLDVLAGLFGLTAAEAEVAAALVAGATAQAVAAGRGVAVSTVRGHIRAVLGKTGAANLRDLERMLASLPGA